MQPSPKVSHHQLPQVYTAPQQQQQQHQQQYVNNAPHKQQYAHPQARQLSMQVTNGSTGYYGGNSQPSISHKIVHQNASAAVQPPPAASIVSEMDSRFQNINEQAAIEVQNCAMAWATSARFTLDQLTEFEHLSGMIARTHMQSSSLSKLVEIDRGTFGTISKSSFQGRQVAVKQLDSKDKENMIKTKMRELLLELQVLVRLNHPNVVHFYGTATDFVTGRFSFIGLVFEFCEFGSLHHALFEHKGQTMSVKHKLQVCRDMAQGINYLHSKRIVHRDLNSRNILLTQDHGAKIADFGCARVIPQDQVVLRTSTISGSPAYMPPEQMTGQPLTERVDVWALCIIFWEVMFDKKPWHGIHGDFESLKKGLTSGEKLPIPFEYPPYPVKFLSAIRIGMRTNVQNRASSAEVLHEVQEAWHHFNSGK